MATIWKKAAPQDVPKPGDAAALPVGKVLALNLTEEPEQRYFIYLPTRGTHQARMMVTVHGISRHARKHARRFAGLAERYNVVLVAPLFDKHRHPGFQRLGLSGQRADLALEKIIEEVGRLTGANTHQLYMFGYSGGGQFVHRFAMAYPERVASIAIGAAGWYTFPDPDRRFPYGIQPHRKLPGIRFRQEQFLRIPATVLVGEKDDKIDHALRTSRRIDERQGASRFERGQRWVDAMQRAAQQHGFDTPYRFVALPGADHSFSRSVKWGALDRHVFNALFGVEPETDCKSDMIKGGVFKLQTCRTSW